MEKIVILGQVPAKKNSRVLTVRGGTMRSFPNATYMRWEKDALRQLTPRMEPYAHISIGYTFYCKDLHIRDLDNMIASVNDMLVKKGIIIDDNWQFLEIAYAKGALDRESPRVELEINQTSEALE